MSVSHSLTGGGVGDLLATGDLDRRKGLLFFLGDSDLCLLDGGDPSLLVGAGDPDLLLGPGDLLLSGGDLLGGPGDPSLLGSGGGEGVLSLL